MPSTTPQQSVRGFVAPTSMPIKKTPDITEVTGERYEVTGVPIPHTSHPTPHTPNPLPHTLNPTPVTPDFPTHWRAMFNHVFASVPTIYIPLKETLPEIENNIVKVIVKNEVQKEHFEAKIRDVLEYLRTHFDEKVEDIVVEANEQLETKKIIYDVKEKLQNFKEQNPEIDDFLQILELKIKD